ncbi:mismatch repair protein PMS1 [Trypanosoma brucei equiperdum]|uniref:Mismatch repair protein PMS1 n=1 Tax=Trypanosoma brucei equiperdum TaxID=630700 RepID=A0A3L6L1X9_9TRYP|nr:mismatch repair protein PMS1 [Trypanosoma brucei equiperdum]
MITLLDEGSSRKLSAGQVITNLSSVVKELVENSLDAGARTVAIRVEDSGAGNITVEDDGSGMDLSYLLDSEGRLKEDASLPLLASRATTKRRGGDSGLSSQAAQTLGFRGEALHSLAHLSELSICTMSESTRPTALLIAYDSNSRRTTVKVTSERRDVGTTVVVSKLFAALPVRHKDFVRGRKKQLLAATLLMKQYALSHPHVRLLMTHRAGPDSAPVTLVSLTGTGDPQRALAEAYGGRVIANMERVEWELTFGTITGYVSKGNAGRLSSDMQVFALDGRLVDLPMMAKAVNDAYAESLPNAAQRTFPAFFLHVSSGESLPYDVNLVPDKRKVLISDEERHAGEVRTCGLRTFQASTDGIDLPVRNEGGWRHVPERRNTQETMPTQTPLSATSIAQFIYQRRETSQGDNLIDNAAVAQVQPSVCLSQLLSGSSPIGRISSPDATASPTSTTNRAPSERSAGSVESVLEYPLTFEPTQKRQRLESSAEEGNTGDTDGSSWGEEDPRELGPEEMMGTDDAVVNYVTDDTNQQRPGPPRSSVRFPPFSVLAEMPLVHSLGEWAAPSQPSDGGGVRKFSRLQKQTEEELTLYLGKESFKNMVVHGQFNHGFIVTSLDDNIFVIDQHAADEKGNYEHLMSHYVARPQPLFSPVPVSMEPQAVDLAVDHAEELRQHGFIVQRSDDTNKLLVLSVPVIPYEVVDPQNVVELIRQLVHYNTISKPMRCVWHSMATKACRSSIMVGTMLSEKKMRSVVDRMGELEQPWNCPHGRPTVRHVSKISSLVSLMTKSRRA